MRVDSHDPVDGEHELHLREAGPAKGFHVGKKKYEAISALDRSAADATRIGWGRFDTPGRTFYTAESPECAYAEVLAPFRRSIDGTDPLAEDAAAMGIHLDDLLAIVSREWGESGFMGIGALPKSWREDRQLCTIETRIGGWLVDIEHPHSMAAIERARGPELLEAGVSMLTVGILRGDDRKVTTLVSEYLAGLVLAAGGTPLGVRFGSKHGYGWCHGYWLNNFSEGSLEHGALHVKDANSILASDSALQSVAQRFAIRLF